MADTEENLGAVIKAARLLKKYTRKQLSEKIGISIRYLTDIENRGRKPSYDVFYNIIMELHIPLDAIFCYKSQRCDLEKGQLIRMIEQCDKNSLRVLYATASELLKNQHDEKGL